MASDEEIKQRLYEKADGGKISCAEALAVVRDMEVSSLRVGALLDDMNVTIIKCQLGCFE
ncbi:MAG: hypothetical protein HZB92_05805 [Euryarchaeota archaeon]|nr:hypothetical protein [Euryarchaeota archaeon]